MSLRIIKLLLVFLAFWGAARFCHHQTAGFRLLKIADNTSPLALPSSDPPLSKQFTYLGRGLECFCFLSEDGKTVLKLFNNRYQTRLFWLHLLPSFSWQREQIAYQQKKLKMGFESYGIAFTLLKDKTALLALHPQKTSNPLCTTLVDKLGISHPIDLSQHAFALQKRAILVHPYLAECAEKKEWDRAASALHGLVQLIQQKMERGIADRDPLIRTNYGFVDDQPVQIDIGPLYLDESLKNVERQKEELDKIFHSLKKWLEKNHPEMIVLLDEALN